MPTLKSDIYQTVTDQIVEAIEKGGLAKARRPWHTFGARTGRPRNAASRKPYRGVNVLALWAMAHLRGYRSGEWATYQQWSERGAQVQRGQKSTQVVFWKFFADAKETETPPAAHTSDDARKAKFMVRGYHVFNAEQVTGWEPKELDTRTEPERIAAADSYFDAIGADVLHGGDTACYIPSQDRILLPHLKQFDTAHDYYSVKGHELTHWTANAARLNRDLTGRFKSESYAAEELVAELGAAFLCAQLGLESTPREDHAAYIANWLSILKGDKYAIFTAAREAQRAVDFMNTAANFDANGEAIGSTTENGGVSSLQEMRAA